VKKKREPRANGDGVFSLRGEKRNQHQPQLEKAGCKFGFFPVRGRGKDELKPPNPPQDKSPLLLLGKGVSFGSCTCGKNNLKKEKKA